MRRPGPVVLLSLLSLAAAGCGGGETTLPPVSAATPQEMRLDWVEPTSTAHTSPRLVFEVERIMVGRDGWKADVAIHNETGVSWRLGGPKATSAVPFGVMLFATGNLTELEDRNRAGDLPGVRDAHTATPRPPEMLDPGRSWEGTIAAPGALAAGRWLRVVFGPLFAQSDPSGDLPKELVWITDNAYQLES